ncbi:MAG: aa3-type cytochrome c oxidase subunit IV [Pseudomonadota bacterium]
MAEHKHGEMNTSIQEKTFDGFMKWTTWSVIIILAVIILMAMFIT